MPVSEEEFKAMVSAINLASWGAKTVYSELPHDDLSDDQKAALKKTYDLREFYRDEILAHLSYDLIAKASAEENVIRNSITKIGFLNNNYQFSFIGVDDSRKIEAWKKANDDNPNISVLIVQPKPGIFRTPKPSLWVLSDGKLRKFELDPEQLVGITSAFAPAGVGVGAVPAPVMLAAAGSSEIIELPNNNDVCKKLLADVYQQNGLHLPFKFCAQNDSGECFVPNRSGGFSWKPTAVNLADQTYGLYDVNRFSRDDVVAGVGVAVEANAGAGVPVSATAEVGVAVEANAGAGVPVPATAGAGIAAVGTSNTVWVNKALKCFVLSPHVGGDVPHPESAEVTMLWAGTHDAATVGADLERSAGHDSFARHKDEFLKFMTPIITSASVVVSPRKINVTSVGHSLGGALAQLSLKAILSDPSCKSHIASFALAIKNSTGVMETVAVEYKRLVTDNPELKHKARFSFVEGDAVQQTGDRTLGDELSIDECEISLCKVITPLQSQSTARNIAYTTFIASAGASAAFLFAPPVALGGAILYALGAGGIFAAGLGIAHATSSTKNHTRKYFTDGLGVCIVEYANNTTKAGVDKIKKELGTKSSVVKMILGLVNATRSSDSSEATAAAAAVPAATGREAAAPLAAVSPEAMEIPRGAISEAVGAAAVAIANPVRRASAESSGSDSFVSIPSSSPSNGRGRA